MVRRSRYFVVVEFIKKITRQHQSIIFIYQFYILIGYQLFGYIWKF